MFLVQPVAFIFVLEKKKNYLILIALSYTTCIDF